MFKWWRAATSPRSVVSIRGRSSSSSSSSTHTVGKQRIDALRRGGLKGSRISPAELARGRISVDVFTQKVLWDVKIKGEARPREYVIHKKLKKQHRFTAEKKQIESIIESVRPEFFFTTLFDIRVFGPPRSTWIVESGKILPRKILRDKESGEMVNIVCLWAHEGGVFKVDVPIVFKGEDACPGLKKGGYLFKIIRSVKYQSAVEHIPQYIEADISNLDIGNKVMIHDVSVHPTLERVTKCENVPLCKIVKWNPNYSEAAEA